MFGMNSLWLMPTEVPATAAPVSVVRLVLPEGEHITTEIAESFAEQVRAEGGGVPQPVLIVISGIASLSRGARAVFSRSRSASAIALVGASAVDRVLANFLLGGEPPACPTSYFGDEDTAVAWLLERIHGS